MGAGSPRSARALPQTAPAVLTRAGEGGGNCGGADGSTEPETSVDGIEVELDLQEDIAVFDGEPESELRIGESFGISSAGFGEPATFRWRVNGELASNNAGVSTELIENEGESRSQLTIGAAEAPFAVGVTLLIVLEVTTNGDRYSGSHSLTVVHP